MMGQRIAAAGIRPSLIVASPAVRAWKTARAVAGELGYPVEFLQREDALYLASLDEIIDVVGAQDEKFNSLMVVGHNPGMTEFANFLLPGITNNLPTAGVLSVSMPQDDWTLRNRPVTTLVLYDSPRTARESR